MDSENPDCPFEHGHAADDTFPDEGNSIADSIMEQQVDVDVEKLYEHERKIMGDDDSTAQEHFNDGCLTKQDFRQLFSYEENDRSAKELKRDYKTLMSQLGGQMKFRDLVGKWSSDLTC